MNKILLDDLFYLSRKYGVPGLSSVCIGSRKKNGVPAAVDIMLTPPGVNPPSATVELTPNVAEVVSSPVEEEVESSGWVIKEEKDVKEQNLNTSQKSNESQRAGDGVKEQGQLSKGSKQDADSNGFGNDDDDNDEGDDDEDYDDDDDDDDIVDDDGESDEEDEESSSAYSF